MLAKEAREIAEKKIQERITQLTKDARKYIEDLKKEIFLAASEGKTQYVINNVQDYKYINGIEHPIRKHIREFCKKNGYKLNQGKEYIDNALKLRGFNVVFTWIISW